MLSPGLGALGYAAANAIHKQTGSRPRRKDEMRREHRDARTFRARLAPIAAILLLATLPLAAAEHEDGTGEDKGPFARLEWRAIGPTNMSGRVAAVAGVPGDPRVVYVGAASGGVWKTEDGGMSFAPIFDDQPIASIGAVALAPSNPEVIYVGTGESNVRNSVSFGNGVYKSTDGGKTWAHVGLEDTQYVSRIAVHPTDPDVVYVAAVGHIFGPNEERGVFRSKDGGKTWEKVLYLDADHGASDLDVDPHNPNVVFAALWHFRRKPWTFTSGSDKGGVWRSLDGGDSWEKLEDGLPRTMGRIGVRVAPSNGRVVYVIAESNDGILFRSDDRGDSFRKVNDDVELVSRGFYYSRVRVDPQDENKVYAVASRLFRSIDGGKSFARIARSVHIDFHDMWIDPLDPNRIWVGEDGGVAVTYDGDAWEPMMNLPLGQYYQVFHGMEEPFYTVGGGLQDNGTWYGPSRTREPAGILADDWRMMSFGDAYWTVVHPQKSDLFISESQAGGIVKTDMATRQQRDVSPQPRRNDGGPASELEYRFNWNSPIVASPHDPLTVYFCGNVVFRSRDFGESWEVISPDLTTDDPEKQKTAGGPVWPENTTAEYHTTIISFAESPRLRGVLWAGTDDGNLQLSRDDGKTWTKIAVPGVPEHSPVSHVEPSRAADGRLYVAFDRHMFDDFRPHVYRSEDYGQSFERITDGLPEQGWVWVVREDPRNPDLLYAGTEVGLFASWDRGGSWQELSLANLPSVAVHDVLVHPRENDLILGTHGRAIWIFDDATPIQQFGDVAGKKAHLFPARPALHFPMRFTRYGLGDKAFRGPNPPYGALLTYYLAEAVEPPAEGGVKPGGGGEEADDAGEGEEAAAEGGEEAGAAGAEAGERLKLEILDADGAVIRTLRKLPAKKGLNRVAWDLRGEPPLRRSTEPDPMSEFFGPPGGASVLPGTYLARLTVGGEVHETAVEVRLDPGLSTPVEDLRAARDMVAQLVDLSDGTVGALRALDRLKEQAEARRQTFERMQDPRDRSAAAKERGKAVAELFGELDKALKKQLEPLARDPDKPFWSQGPKLGDRPLRLAFSLDRAFARPTAAQAEYFEELRAEITDVLSEVDRFLSEDVPAFNRRLAEYGIPPLAVPSLAAAEEPGETEETGDGE